MCKVIQSGSHYFELFTDFCDRNFIEDLVSAKYPAVDVFANIVNKFYLK